MTLSTELILAALLSCALSASMMILIVTFLSRE